MPLTKTVHKNLHGIKSPKTISDSFEEKFNLLMDTIEDLVFILDFEGCFESVSYKGAVGLGYLPNELRKKHITEIAAERNKAALIGSIRQILSSNKKLSFTLFLLSKSFEEIKYHVTLRPITNEGKITGLIGVCKNLSTELALQEKITTLKENLLEINRLLNVEKQRSKRQKIILEELNRLKNEFVSHFSHEMRTPLSTIIGFSEAICSDDQLSDLVKRDFQREILNEAKRLAKMINDALEATDLESGKSSLVKSEFDLLELLRNVIIANKSSAKSKNISLEYELPTEKFTTNADKDKISDVFESLIKNAIKHTRRTGKVKIYSQIFPHEIEIIFTDTGRGISPNDFQNLIKPTKSFRIISKVKSETGIGLDFAKKIVELHDGYMDIQSEIDKGTAIIIKLPRFSTE